VLAVLRGRAHAPDAADAAPAGHAAGRPSTMPAVRMDAAATVPSAKFINPVCGMAVDTAAPKHVERYDGIAYYFCCDGCLTTFRQDPAKYAAIHRASMATVSA